MGCGAKMGNTELWVWLTSKEFINSGKVTSLLEHFDSIEEIYNADFYDDITGIYEKEKRDVLDKRLDGAEKIIEKINAIGARIVTFEDENYPPPLRQIAEPPYVLYMKGNRRIRYYPAIFCDPNINFSGKPYCPANVFNSGYQIPGWIFFHCGAVRQWLQVLPLP